MERDKINESLCLIRTSGDKSVVLNEMVRLRTDVVISRTGILLFKELGGIPLLTKFLNKPYEKIIAMVLSILGNCCTQQLCADEAIECRIITPLITILKSMSNPVIQCRACRLLGNLSKFNLKKFSHMYGSSLATSVCQIIEETSDAQTRLMAFRASRFLLVDSTYSNCFHKTQGLFLALKLLTAIMKSNEPSEVESKQELSSPKWLKENEHREKYFKEVVRHLEGVRSDIFDREMQKNSVPLEKIYQFPKEKIAQELSMEILKCLLIISEKPLSNHVSKNMIVKNINFDALVFCITENTHRKIALKTLSNLCKYTASLSCLTTSQAMAGVCYLLTSQNLTYALGEDELRHCINIIVMLSNDSCNRSKVRLSGALLKLIHMLRDSYSYHEMSMILTLLNNFQYDLMSLKLMLDKGLISILIKKLQYVMSSDDEYYKRKIKEKISRSTKRKLPASDFQFNKLQKVEEIDYKDVESASSSPPSSLYPSSTSPSSSCSSRGMSPLLDKHIDDNDYDDNTYSPVCSEDEDDCEPQEQVNDSNEAVASINVNSMSSYTDRIQLLDIADHSQSFEENTLGREDENDVRFDEAAALPLTCSFTFLDVIEVLLLRITELVAKGRELGETDTLNTLIKAVHVFGGNTYLVNILSNIFVESRYFSQIVKHRIVHQIYLMSRTNNLTDVGKDLLTTLSNVSESNYGKSEVSSLLRSEDPDLQKSGAIAAAFLIRDRRLLIEMMVDKNALSILFSIILEKLENNQFTEQAMDGLTYMCSRTLNLSIPRMNSDRFEEFDTFDHQSTSLTPSSHLTNDIRFVITEKGADNASNVIQFNRQLLCDYSEVFNTMLHSDFLEGNEGEIKLTDYSAMGVKYFLNLIVRKSQALKINVPSPKDYCALLEAFELSRIYIMPEFEEATIEPIIYLVDESNCMELLNWSIRNCHQCLREIALKYYLCSTLPPIEKITLFREAEYSSEVSNWFPMLFSYVLECFSN